MITAQPQDQQTGLYSRIDKPYSRITTSALDARIHAATNPNPFTSPFAGAGTGSGLFARLRAWLRGER